MYKEIIFGIIILMAIRTDVFAQPHIIDHYPDITLVNEEISCDDKKDGEYKYQGKVYVVTNCRNKKKDGVQILRPQQGTEWGNGYEEHYKDGVLDSVQKRFDLNGSVWEIENYSRGELDGLLTSYYYTEGKIKEEVEYKDGKKNGFDKKYSQDGKLISQTQYKHGEPGFTVTHFLDNKNINMEEIPFKLVFEDEWETFGTMFPCDMAMDCAPFSNLIVRNIDEFTKKFGPIVKNKLPSLDFDKYMVLGNFTRGSCGSYFERFVIKDISRKIYMYVIRIQQPSCISGPGNRSLNVIIIPKVPSNYKIEFKVEGKENQNTGKIKFLGFFP
jgi:antitoxin component YwqK of YwqJK toxin-antitoxin module